MKTDWFRQGLFALTIAAASLTSGPSLAQQAGTPSAGSATAADMADFFSQVGNQIYEDCIFELSEEQIEVQQGLIQAYIKHGATSIAARRLAVKQIQPPRLSAKCEEIKGQSKPSVPSWTTTTTTPVEKKAPVAKAAPKVKIEPIIPSVVLAEKKMLPQWDCGSGVDFVTIKHKGYERKLTDGEICNPFDDVVRAVPDHLTSFRFGYVIRTGRLFIISDDPQTNGKTIAWAISGREACRNNPDPDCLAARAVGPLPPGEYSFAGEKDKRVSWGPNAKRMVAGVYLRKLWHRDKYTPAQTASILARGNIAIHVRLKGEMSEACLGLEPKGWAYVSSLIGDGRVTGLNVHIDEPYPQIAEKPPIVATSSFSLSSLFK